MSELCLLLVANAPVNYADPVVKRSSFNWIGEMSSSGVIVYAGDLPKTCGGSWGCRASGGGHAGGYPLEEHALASPNAPTKMKIGTVVSDHPNKHLRPQAQYKEFEQGGLDRGRAWAPRLFDDRNISTVFSNIYIGHSFYHHFRLVPDRATINILEKTSRPLRRSC
ncbi:hypothetical protein T492DRAFT_1000825 [Pavlovales sp. CCMP2436]|nr:hypothetical protein T492DRAFT_1000825 [Pavlovales sp. CCMP2436]